MFKKIAIATLSAAALMGAASAQDKTVDIDGTLNQLTFVNGANTVVSAGLLAEAKSNIGSIDNVDIDGMVNQLTFVNGANTVVAAGLLAESCSSIGTVGKSC